MRYPCPHPGYTLSRYEPSSGLWSGFTRNRFAEQDYETHAGGNGRRSSHRWSILALLVSHDLFHPSSIHCITIEIFASSPSVSHRVTSKKSIITFTTVVQYSRWWTVHTDGAQLGGSKKLERALITVKCSRCECNRHHRAGSTWTFRWLDLINCPGV